jgi:hypothetical protein
LCWFLLFFFVLFLFLFFLFFLAFFFLSVLLSCFFFFLFCFFICFICYLLLMVSYYGAAKDSGGECSVVTATLYPLPAPASAAAPYYAYASGSVFLSSFPPTETVGETVGATEISCMEGHCIRSPPRPAPSRRIMPTFRGPLC